jgi:hypothetical protein
MNPSHRLLPALLFFIAGILHAQTTALPPVKPPAAISTLRVLFIGNGVTYKDGMPAMFAELAANAAAPHRIDSRVVWFDGATLQNHWDKGDKGEARAAISQGPWDYIVLQENSRVPPKDAEVMYRATRLFDAEIRKSGARTVIFQPWAWNESYETIVDIEAATQKISKETGAQLVPVGAAWKIVQKDFPRLLLLDSKAVPTPAAVYLTASVFQAVLLKQKPEAPNQLPHGLNGIDARALRSVAWEVAQAVK